MTINDFQITNPIIVKFYTDRKMKEKRMITTPLWHKKVEGFK